MAWIVAVSQAVFSKQIFSKWFRVEWLRIRREKVYDDVYRMFQSKPSAPTFNAMTLDFLGTYETAKTTADIALLSKLLREMNDRLPQIQARGQKMHARK